MSKNCSKLVSFSLAAFTVVLMLVSASSVQAQSIHNKPLLSERERQQRQMDQRHRPPDTELRSARYIRAEGERHLAGAVYVKRNADRIRFLNREISGEISQDANPDYKAIAKLAGEIRKRASQLRRYLGLPKPDDAATFNQSLGRMERVELLAALARLDAVIKNFGANPLLDKRNVIDASQATSAGRDLEEIITLSDGVSKSAKRLSRKTR